MIRSWFDLTDMGSILHLANFFFMLITASAPVYIAFKIRGTSTRLVLLSMTLATFAIVHAFYHLSEFLEMGEISDQVLLPLSVILLVVFGLYYLRSGA